MIAEFALDPDCVASSGLLVPVRQQVGFEHGRIFSAYPKFGDWKKLAQLKIRQLPHQDRKRAEIILSNLSKNRPKLFANSGRVYRENGAWIENACESHAQYPFAGIITEKADACDGGLAADNLGAEESPWDLSFPGHVERECVAMAELSRNLLRCSSMIRFVDPYFNPSSKRFRRPLEHFLQHVGSGCPATQIEYHLSSEKLDGNFFEHGLEELRKKLDLPDDFEMTFHRWEDPPRGTGETQHPRCVLTNCGGIGYENGLDDDDLREGEDPPDPRDTTIVYRLPEATRLKFWKNFEKSTSPFKLVDGWKLTSTSVDKLV